MQAILKNLIRGWVVWVQIALPKGGKTAGFTGSGHCLLRREVILILFQDK